MSSTVKLIKLNSKMLHKIRCTNYNGNACQHFTHMWTSKL